MQDIGLAADLAIFDISLTASGGFIDRGDIPFSAGGALKAGLHVGEDTPTGSCGPKNQGRRTAGAAVPTWAAFGSLSLQSAMANSCFSYNGRTALIAEVS